MSVQEFLPSEISQTAILALIDSLALPKTIKVDKPGGQGAYHLVYKLQFAPEDLDKVLAPLSPKHPHSRSSLLLRVSGTHLPRMKTENESAILAYVARHTSIPIPTIVRFSSSTKNPLNYEYQLMTISLGDPVDAHFHDFDEERTQIFFDQVAEALRELHSLPISHIGGLRFDVPESQRSSLSGLAPTASIVPAPLCEEFLWQAPSITKHWHTHGLHETLETLNAQGPFSTWTSYTIAWIHKYIYATSRHPLLAEMRDLIPRLKSLITLLSDPSFVQRTQLNEMRLLLAHRDLHFSNLLWDPTTKRITAVLDWEFSGAAPFCRWDPPKAFLASLPYDQEGILRKRRWVEMFKERCRERGIEWRELIWDGDSEFGWKSEEQKWVFSAVDYLRCICEVGPTGERREVLGQWKGEVERNLKTLGVE
ncbi:hypothetical protein MMC10_004159 [Thelotrema lepadinum]|nr:hypothetical protein [Thelotrema lepadinum]